MREVEFHVPPSAQLAGVGVVIESLCAEEGLQVGIKSSLARFPGSIHWHFKRSGERGTLEIKLFPQDGRIWAQIQDGRRAAWIDPCMAKIKHALEARLNQFARAVR